MSNVMNADSLELNFVNFINSLLAMLLFMVICCPQLNLYNNYKFAELVWLYIGYWTLDICIIIHITYYQYYIINSTQIQFNDVGYVDTQPVVATSSEDNEKYSCGVFLTNIIECVYVMYYIIW